jgi:hypothetical protein
VEEEMGVGSRGGATTVAAYCGPTQAAAAACRTAAVAAGDVTEPPNYTRLSRKIIQRKDNLTNLSPYNPVVREISTDFKPFHITAKIVLILAVTIISYINVRSIKYIGV